MLAAFDRVPRAGLVGNVQLVFSPVPSITRAFISRIKASPRIARCGLGSRLAFEGPLP